jgi:hypothetical protein
MRGDDVAHHGQAETRALHVARCRCGPTYKLLKDGALLRLATPGP